MRGLVKLRDNLKAFYGDYSMYILPVLKFALAIALYFMITHRIGHLEVLNSLFVLLILAAISAILPLNGMALIGTGLIVGHCFGLGIEVGLFAAVLYLLLLVLYFRFVARDALALLLGPVACRFNLHAALPLSLGVFRGAESAFSAICGLISWRFVNVIEQVIAPMKAQGDTGAMRMIQAIPGEVFNRELLLYAIAFAAAAVIVSVICRHLTTFTRLTAVIIGAVIYLVVMLVGGLVLGVETNAGRILIGTILSALITLALNVFVYSVDYAKAKFIQLEDDEYYYYVKAIPKIRADGAAESAERDTPPEAPAEQAEEVAPVISRGDFENIDFETKLENSLKDL